MADTDIRDLTWDSSADWANKQASERVVHHDIGSRSAEEIALGYGQDAIDDSEMAVYLPFDDDGEGSSQNWGLNPDDWAGQIIGEPTRGVGGVMGSTAWEFDGENDIVNGGLSSHDIYNREAFSIGAWLYASPTIADDTGGVIAKYRQGDDVREFAMHQNNDSGDTADVTTWFFEDSTDFDSRVTVSSGEFPFGEWHHVGTVFNGGEYARGYLDGELVDEVSVNFNQVDRSTEDSRIYVGIRDRDFVRYYAGRIDELCLCNRALSDGEMQALYTTAFSGSLTTGTRRISDSDGGSWGEGGWGEDGWGGA